MHHILLSPDDLKCLQEHLKPLNQLLVKLQNGAVVANAPNLIKKPETKKQGISRMLKMIEAREAKKLSK